MNALTPFPLDPPSRLPSAWRRRFGRLLQGAPRGRSRKRRAVCAFALGRIGDFILCLSALRLLVREAGPGETTIVLPPIVRPLAQRELPGVEILTLPADAAGLLRDIVPAWCRHRGQFADCQFARRVVFNHLRGLYHEIATTWAQTDADHRLDVATYPREAAGNGTRELEAHRRVVSLALGREISPREVLPGFTQFESRADGRLLVYPLSEDPARTLPPAQVTGILRRWRDRCPAPIVLGGPPAQATKLAAYAAACRDHGVDGVTVETPAGVEAFIAHVGGAGAVLAGDSAAAHAAIAFDKPTVVILSREWHTFTQPWRKSAAQRHFFPEEAPGVFASALPEL